MTEGQLPKSTRPEITLIRKGGPNPVMSKRIFLDEQGKVCSDGSLTVAHPR
jgi:hypothetical protein